jgi:hypothetical protein
LVIDVTLANPPIMRWTILADGHATGSNNKVVELEVEMDRQEHADHQRVVGWN